MRTVAVLALSTTVLFIAVAAAQAQTVTIAVTSFNTQSAPHNIAPLNRVNKGDSIDFRDLLINRVAQFGKAKGKAVAYDIGELRYTSATATVMSVEVIFPGIGSFTYSGKFNSNAASNVLPITGGTGGFHGAKGTVTIGAGATTAPNTYAITVPGTPLNIHGGAGGVS